MAHYRLEHGAPSADAVALFEAESVEDLRDLVSDALADTTSGIPRVFALHPRPSPPFTIPEAMALLVELAETRLPSEAIVRCLLPSEKAVAIAARELPGPERPRRETTIGRFMVEVRLGDLTRTHADAIVNASNARLVLGGGVSGALRRAVADPAGLQAAMSALAPIADGGVVVTGAFGLAGVRSILHAATVLGEAGIIELAMKNLLAACERQGIESLALPALGCGTGGLAVERFARIARAALEDASVRSDTHPAKIIFVLYDGDDFERFTRTFLDR